MKKTILPAILMILFSTNRSSAQTSLPSGQPVKTGNEWHMPTDALTRSRNFTDRLSRKLGLDSVTAKRVYDAYLANTKSVDEISMATVNDDEKKERMKANRLAFDRTLEGILSAKQFAGYQEMEKDKKSPLNN
jgi:hypothetical protein